MDTPDEEFFAHPVLRREYYEKKYPELYAYLTRYEWTSIFSEKLYCWINHIETQPLCKACDNPVKYNGFYKGYNQYCSKACCNRDPEKKQRTQDTCIARYGVSNVTKLSTTKSKYKQTCLKKYGVENVFQSEAVKEKIKQTNITKYGVGSLMQSEAIRNKSKQTCLKKYEVENPTQSKTIKNKAKQTCLKKYGVENPLQSAVIRNKYKETCLKKYGVGNPMQSSMIKDKLSSIISSDKVQNNTKQTCLNRYGVEYPSQSTEVQNKVKSTCLKKYGVERYTQSAKGRDRLSNILGSKEIQDKVKQTCLDRYGVERYTQSTEGRNKLSNILGSQEIQDKINTTKRINYTFSTSKIEDMFDTYLNEHDIQHIRQYKSTLYPFCCDFYLPAYDLYIEIQASWTHGGHPYDAERDAEKLKCWQSKHTRYYDTAIETWTQRDVKKRETAKLNNLNYLEIFSNDINECIKQFEEYIHDHSTGR